MTLAQLIKALREIGFSLDAGDIADIIWLAKHLPNDARLQKDRTHVDDINTDLPFSIPPNAAHFPVRRDQNSVSKVSTVESRKTSARAGLYVSSPFENGAGLSFGAAGVQVLPNKLSYGRALHPLLRKVPSQYHHILNEDATVQRIADTQIWLPVMRPDQTQWLELNLVIDEWPSIILWRETIRELIVLLTNMGAFRSIQIWSLWTSAGGDEIELHSGWGPSAEKAPNRPLKELISTRGNRLIILLSDAVSPAWHNGKIARTIQPWVVSELVLLLNLLPYRFWSRTGLVHGLQVYFRAHAPGIPNIHLTKTPAPDTVLEVPENGFIPLPALPFDPNLILAWAQSVSGRNNVWVPGIMLPINGIPKDDDTTQQTRDAESKEPSARVESDEDIAITMVRNFRRNASPSTWKLAGYLSATVQLSLPLMRLVQRVMLPRSHPEHLAEFYLSGLIRHQKRYNSESDKDARYEFLPGVRHILLSSISRNEAVDVLRHTSKFIARESGKTISFDALVADPSLVSQLDTEKLPFAEVTQGVLRALGGEYARLSDVLAGKEVLVDETIETRSSDPTQQEIKGKSAVEKQATIDQESIEYPEIEEVAWHLAHPYPMPPNFTGRLAERTRLTSWLDEDTRNRLLVLRSLGGFGKTALSWHWLTHDVDAKIWQKVIWWSFYEGDASFEHFVEDALKYLKLELPLGQRPQVDELLKAMQSQKILVILDGFERVLRAYANLNAAYRGDDAPRSEDNDRDCININAETFLKNTCTLPGIKSKVLMTTRLMPRAIESHGILINGCLESELMAMHSEDAVEFFRMQKIRGTHSEIEAACALYGYHPLSLRLLAGYILKDYDNPGDIVVARKIKIDGSLNQQRHHVLEVSYNRLQPRDQKLLSTIACFRSPVELSVLKAVSASKDDDSVERSLVDLVECGLLDFDEKNKRFDLHPIVKRYAYDRLTVPERTSLHSRLQDYFSELDAPTRPSALDDLAPTIELYHHLVRAGNLDSAVELYQNRLDQTLYYQFGAYQVIIELMTELFPDGEEKRPRVKSEGAQLSVMTALADAYVLSGQVNKALPLLNSQRSLQEKLGNKRNIARVTNVAFQAQLHLGLLREADRNLRRGVGISQEINDSFSEAIGRQQLGYLLSNLGNWDEAERELNVAYRLLERENNSRALSTVMNYRALRVLLMLRDEASSKRADSKTVIEFAQRSAALAEEATRTSSPNLRESVRAGWLLGSAYRLEHQLTLANDLLSRALINDRSINLIEDESNILLDLARLRNDQKRFDEAKSLAEEALSITQRCGYVLQGADANLFLAHFVLEQERNELLAGEYAQEALKLATCDGPPYYYKVAYREAEKLLSQLRNEGKRKM